ncbi:hypothetical protein V5799_006238 [Amblyomma americanum]|uniref:Uncharacterized protein n=1 Tax=Amblyomma americanum TaxID=6943 RepID=A0AAQ4DWZ4_AMBAM
MQGQTLLQETANIQQRHGLPATCVVLPCVASVACHSEKEAQAQGSCCAAVCATTPQLIRAACCVIGGCTRCQCGQQRQLDSGKKFSPRKAAAAVPQVQLHHESHEQHEEPPDDAHYWAPSQVGPLLDGPHVMEQP